MKSMHFNIDINAPKEKVWNALWDYSNYRQWTSVFSESSNVVTDNWKEGSKVLFVDEQGSGMVSKVEANRANEYMSFQHLGEVKNGIEDTTSEKVQAWNGAMENYTLTETSAGTHVAIELTGMPEAFTDYFEQTWPKALDKLKEIAEEIEMDFSK